MKLWLAVLGLLLSCRHRAQNADVKYGTLNYDPAKNSLLTTFRDKEKLLICFSDHGTNFTLAKNFYEAGKASVTKALNLWNSALRDSEYGKHPSSLWKRKTIVTDFAYANVGACPENTDLKIHFYSTDAEWAADCKRDGRMYGTFGEACRSYAVPWDHEFFFSYVHTSRYKTHPDDVASVYLHELGHMLGLADTYDTQNNIGTVNFPGQPNSVMNRKSPVLVKDDIDGLVVVWRALLEGNARLPKCGSRYVEYRPPNAHGDATYCRPKGEFEVNMPFLPFEVIAADTRRYELVPYESDFK